MNHAWYHVVVAFSEPEPPNAAFRLLSIKELAQAEQESSAKVCSVLVLIENIPFVYNSGEVEQP